MIIFKIKTLAQENFCGCNSSIRRAWSHLLLITKFTSSRKFHKGSNFACPDLTWMLFDWIQNCQKNYIYRIHGHPTCTMLKTSHVISSYVKTIQTKLHSNTDYKYSWMSSSLTTDGVSTPRSVKSKVRYCGGV